MAGADGGPRSLWPRALTVAGSDSGGGAGVQADLKTFQMLGVYGMTAVTAVTAQNTLGVQGIHDVPAEMVAAQMDAVFADLGVDAMKTGMLSQAAVIEAVAAAVERWGIRKLVVDPVMYAKGGARLLQEDAQDALRRRLLPLSCVVTPNLPEAEALLGQTIRSVDEMKEAAQALCGLGPRCAIVKGGHLEGPQALDVVFDGREFRELASPRISTPHTHGTGCTFSAAIAAYLARGRSFFDAVSGAKSFLTAAVREAPGLGGGHGPTNHWAELAGGNPAARRYWGL